MGAVVLMPKLGLTMETGRVLSWRKKEGETVEKGHILLDVETDKIVNEVESPASGTLLKILVPEGEEVKVQTVLAVVGEPGEDIDALAQTGGGGAISEEGGKDQAVEQAVEESPRVSEMKKRQRITPRAKRLLSELGISPAELVGIKQERINEADVRDFLQRKKEGARGNAKLASESGKRFPLTPVQRVVAERMTQSFRDIPQFSLRFSLEMDRLLELLPQLAGEGEEKITINDLILRAVALALARCPEVQSQYRPDGIFRPGEINLGVAVALEGGLIVPVVRNAERKQVREIRAEVRRLVSRAKENQLLTDEISGGTFTVSNLGMYGITSFVPILNPGEGAILGAGALQEVPWVKEGKVTVSRVVECTLVCDHRSVNGVVGARFSQELKKIVDKEEVSSW